MFYHNNKFNQYKVLLNKYMFLVELTKRGFRLTKLFTDLTEIINFF